MDSFLRKVRDYGFWLIAIGYIILSFILWGNI